MNFKKFVSMLEQSSLILPNSLLFNDKFEGSIPKIVAQLTEDFARNAFESLNASAIARNPENQQFLPPVDETMDHLKKMRSFGRGYNYISCWHMAECESDAMWKLYGSEIAIRSTYNKLDQVIASALKETEVDFAYIGSVKYI